MSRPAGARLILLAAGLLGGCRRQAAEQAAPAPIEVRCVSPKREPFDEVVTLRGRVALPPGGELAVAAQVAGRVLSVAVHEGERVARGDAIASVDDASSRDALRQAEAGAQQARSALKSAEAYEARTTELVRRGIAAKQDLEDATARADAARAAVASNAASLDLARRTLGRVVVRSSFDGVVTRIFRGPGALVDGSQATPIVELASSGGREFLADATERELWRVEEGQAARASFGSSDLVLEGRVRARSTFVDSALGLGSVRVALDPPPGGAAGPTLGAFGQVQITTAVRPAVLVIPLLALRGAVAEGSEIVVCKGDRAEVRAVTVGMRDEGRAEITKGLEQGERVALDHVLGLEDGAVIAVKP